MKVVLSIICWIFAALCCYFPFAYNHSDMDKKEIKISHILVNTQEEAVNIRKDIVDKNATFGEMAEKHSLCPSKKDKGNINYTMRGRYIEEFDSVAFKLALNELSEPVQTDQGWHLIKVTDIKYYSDRENFDRRYF